MDRKPILLEYIPAEQAAKQNFQYIKDRKDGKIKSMSTSLKRLNKHLMGGIEFNTITAIAAPSGGGKSALAKVFRNDFFELNPWCDFNYICFNLEMLCHQQIARQATTHFRKTLHELYSVEEELSDEVLEQIKKYYQEIISKQNLYFVEKAGFAKDIAHTIYTFWRDQCRPLGKVCIFEVDHTLLTLGKDGQREKERVDELMHELVLTKKKISAEGGVFIGLVLSQLNRDHKSTERIADPSQHAIRTSDIFAASSIEFASDLILAQNMPAKLGIQSYTMEGYPTVYQIEQENGELENVNALYLHNIKNRSGETDKIYPLENKLKYFEVSEIDLDDFQRRHQEFITTGNSVVSFNENN